MMISLSTPDDSSNSYILRKYVDYRPVFPSPDVIAKKKDKIKLLRGCSSSSVFQFILDCLADPDMNDLVNWSKKHSYGFVISTNNFAEEWSRRQGRKVSFVAISRQLQVVEQSVVANQRILGRDKTGHYRFFPDYKGTGLPLIPLDELKSVPQTPQPLVIDAMRGSNVAEHQQFEPPPWFGSGFIAAPVPMVQPQFSFPQHQPQLFPTVSPHVPYTSVELERIYYCNSVYAQHQMYPHTHQENHQQAPNRCSIMPPFYNEPYTYGCTSTMTTSPSVHDAQMSGSQHNVHHSQAQAMTYTSLEAPQSIDHVRTLQLPVPTQQCSINLFELPSPSAQETAEADYTHQSIESYIGKQHPVMPVSSPQLPTDIPLPEVSAKLEQENVGTTDFDASFYLDLSNLSIVGNEDAVISAMQYFNSDIDDNCLHC